jgi:hypothetical protein
VESSDSLTFKYRKGKVEVVAGLWCKAVVEKPHITRDNRDYAYVPTQDVSAVIDENVEGHAESEQIVSDQGYPTCSQDLISVSQYRASYLLRSEVLYIRYSEGRVRR